MTSPSRWDHSRSIEAFQLAPDRIHLNHGSFGAVPLSVQAEQERWRAHIERDPTSFFKDEMPALMRATAQKVAARFGGRGTDWVFCENATSAINGILAAFPLRPGDEIVTTSHAYGAVMKAMRETARRRDAHLVVVDLPAITQSDGDVVQAVAQSFRHRTRLVVIDHITSATATVFPVGRIAAEAKKAGIAVLVDGAHAPGQIPLDVPGVGVDWYTGNAHKWLFAPRGCGVLWTAPERQAETLPAVLSHGTEDGYTAAFDWVGTRDITPWLCFEAGAAFHDSLGGSELMARNRALAAEGVAILESGLGTVCAAAPAQRAAMATVLLKSSLTDPGLPDRFRNALAEEHKVIAPVSGFGGKLWLRVSAQAYNRIEDYRQCLAACLELRDGAFREHFR